jgi:hypothetical protein
MAESDDVTIVGRGEGGKEDDEAVVADEAVDDRLLAFDMSGTGGVERVRLDFVSVDPKDLDFRGYEGSPLNLAEPAVDSAPEAWEYDSAPESSAFTLFRLEDLTGTVLLRTTLVNEDIDFDAESDREPIPLVGVPGLLLLTNQVKPLTSWSLLAASRSNEAILFSSADFSLAWVSTTFCRCIVRSSSC